MTGFCVITVPYLAGSSLIAVVIAYPIETVYVGQNIYDVLEPGPPTQPLGMAIETINWIMDDQK